MPFFGFLAITRLHELRIGRNLVQIDPTSLPELFQQPRSLNNSQKVEKSDIIKFQNFENFQKIGTTISIWAYTLLDE